MAPKRRKDVEGELARARGGPPAPRRRGNPLAAKIAALLKETGATHVQVGPNVGFVCPYCGVLAWFNITTPWVSYHDGDACGPWHAMGPRSFNRDAVRRGLVPERLLPE